MVNFCLTILNVDYKFSVRWKQGEADKWNELNQIERF